jgi:DNA polymerase III delta prime subunit
MNVLEESEVKLPEDERSESEVNLRSLESKLPWQAKHTPVSLDEFIDNDDVTMLLKSIAINKKLNNLLIMGPVGSGKTTLVNCLVNDYLGSYVDASCIKIYGSINRSKDTVSEIQKSDVNITNFIKKKIDMPKDLCKIIVIYDFDLMTLEAQTALRRIIEIYSKNVRFILTCNNIEDVAEAIQSRCVIINLSKPSNIKKILENIAEKEGFTVCDEVTDIIVVMCQGDIKTAINYLQAICNANEVTVNAFYKIFNIPSITIIQDFIVACLKKDSNLAFSIITGLLEDGYNIIDILEILYKVICRNHINAKYIKGIKGNRLDQSIQIQYLKAISQCYYLSETCFSNNHIYSLVANFIRDSQFNLTP